MISSVDLLRPTTVVDLRDTTLTASTDHASPGWRPRSGVNGLGRRLSGEVTRRR
jgi:hypothetical protein